MSLFFLYFYTTFLVREVFECVKGRSQDQAPLGVYGNDPGDRRSQGHGYESRVILRVETPRYRSVTAPR